MARYEYRRERDGALIDIHAPMSRPPPETIVVNEEGGWWPPILSGERGGDLCRRVYGNVAIHIGAGPTVSHKGQRVPISMSLPRRDPSEGTPANRYGHDVVEYSNGEITTPEGDRIIDSRSAADRAAGETGLERKK